MPFDLQLQFDCDSLRAGQTPTPDTPESIPKLTETLEEQMENQRSGWKLLLSATELTWDHYTLLPFFFFFLSFLINK